MKVHAALLLGLCLATGAARAGLFDDDEARKDIAAFRAQVGANQKAAEERLSRIETLVQERAIELAKLIDELKQELAPCAANSRCRPTGSRLWIGGRRTCTSISTRVCESSRRALRRRRSRRSEERRVGK